jgi:NAD(P) transhydrogenase subunit alpha
MTGSYPNRSGALDRLALSPVQLGIPRETRPGETRVAAVPATVETFSGWGWEVRVERAAGLAAGFTDDAYREAGAAIVPEASAASAADLVLRVGPPHPDDLDSIPSGAAIAGFLDPFILGDVVRKLAERQLTGLAVEAIPRTTLAQSMDALSSQANLAGYAAVLLAAEASPKLLPMMVTAAGTIPPSRALILGVGVAGLQAIATARRLGAVVHAYDIRPETAEQVESLGAKFVAAPTTTADEGGYAQEVTDDIQTRQFEALAPFVADSDIIVTTAQIPGRPAPLLITSEMVSAMHPGSVIVDMAAGTGGNVAGSQPDEIVEVGGVTIHGPTNLAGRIPTDASRMYARNLVALLERMRGEDEELLIDLDDDIVGPTAVTHQGEVRHPRSRSLLGLEENAL